MSNAEESARQFEEQIQQLQSKLRHVRVQDNTRNDNDGATSQKELDPLIQLDQKMAAWFLDHQQEDPSKNPTIQEIESYEKSLVARKAVLGAASGLVIPAEMAGEGYRHVDLYQQVYQDMKQFRYAWFGILLDREEYLAHTYLAIKILKELARWQLDQPTQQQLGFETTQLLMEAFEIFRETVCSTGSNEFNERITTLLSEEHEILLDAMILAARYKSRVLSVRFFVTAFRTEMCYSFYDSPCLDMIRSVGEISEDKMSDEELEEAFCLNDELLEEDEEFGIVWNMLEKVASLEKSPVGGKECAFCGKTETPDCPHLRCSQCKISVYCSKTCQISHWKRGHKKWCIKKI